MSTIKSSTEHLTLNADGSGKDIKFQANGVEVASISSTGAFTSTSIDATKLSGALPAIDGSALTSLTSSQMPAGSVVQFVSKNLTATWNTSSTTYISTDLTIDFTPKFANSTILVRFFGSTHYEAANHGRGQIRKNGSTLTGYTGDDLLAYLNNTSSRGQLEGGFWAGPAGSTATATYAYYAHGGGSQFYLYRNHGISVMEIKG